MLRREDDDYLNTFDPLRGSLTADLKGGLTDLNGTLTDLNGTLNTSLNTSLISQLLIKLIKTFNKNIHFSNQNSILLTRYLIANSKCEVLLLIGIIQINLSMFLL